MSVRSGNAYTTAGMPGDANDAIVNNTRIIRQYNSRESLFNEAACGYVMMKERASQR